MKQHCKVKPIFDVHKAVEDFKNKLKEQGYYVTVIVEGDERI